MPSRTIVHELYTLFSHCRRHFQYYASAFIDVFCRRRGHLPRLSVVPVLAGQRGFEGIMLHHRQRLPSVAGREFGSAPGNQCFFGPHAAGSNLPKSRDLNFIASTSRPFSRVSPMQTRIGRYRRC